MSAVSQRLRDAALGRAPRHPTLACGWLKDDDAALRLIDRYIGVREWNGFQVFSNFTEDECRMFLLFVAEAEERQ